jgi:hypothetical protein
VHDEGSLVVGMCAATLTLGAVTPSTAAQTGTALGFSLTPKTTAATSTGFSGLSFGTAGKSTSTGFNFGGGLGGVGRD